MSISNRLKRIEQRYNMRTHRPLVIAWLGDDEPEFRNKPTTKAQAIAFLKARAREQDRTAEKDLILMPVDSEVPTVETYLMEKFNISEDEL